MNAEPRSYLVRLEDGAGRCRRIEGSSPEEAALAFAEDCEVHEDELVLTVTDEATGRSACLRIDLASGLAGPCP